MHLEIHISESLYIHDHALFSPLFGESNFCVFLDSVFSTHLILIPLTSKLGQGLPILLNKSATTSLNLFLLMLLS